jgi:hypothetical protein
MPTLGLGAMAVAVAVAVGEFLSVMGARPTRNCDVLPVVAILAVERNFAMGPINWIAVVLAALAAGALAFPWYRLWQAERVPSVGRLTALIGPAWLIGHNFARVGAETLAAKPWLYWMMSGGFALFAAIPAGIALYGRHGVKARDAAADATYIFAAFMLMGTVFWAMR